MRMRIDETYDESVADRAAGENTTSLVQLSALRGFGLFVLYVGGIWVGEVLAGVGMLVRFVNRGGSLADSVAVAEHTQNVAGIVGVVGTFLGGLGFAWFTLSRHGGPQRVAFRRASDLPAQALDSSSLALVLESRSGLSSFS